MRDDAVPVLSDAWHAARTGTVTSSRIGAILGLPPANRKESRDRAWRAVRGLDVPPPPPWAQHAMDRGTFLEPYGCRTYRLAFPHTRLHSCNVGIVRHPTEPWVVCTPDGLLDTDGVYEGKAPLHVASWPAGAIDRAKNLAYWAQVQLQLQCTQRAYGRLVYYGRQWSGPYRVNATPCDDVNEYVREVLHVVQIERDDEWWAYVLPTLRAFVALTRSPDETGWAPPEHTLAVTEVAARHTSRVVPVPEAFRVLSDAEVMTPQA